MNILGSAALGRMFAAGRDAVVNANPNDEAQWVTDVRRTWSEHLAGFTRRELQRGLAAVSERKFPPSLGEFKMLCRPALDPEVAWWEADHCLRQRADGLMGDWTHPAVWRAGRQMAMAIRSGDYARHRVQWAVLLKRELAKGIGEGVPEPAMRITGEAARTRPPTDEEKNDIEALRARIRAAATPPPPPPPEEPGIEPISVDELGGIVEAFQAEEKKS